MIIFWLSIAVLAAAAVFIVIPPLLNPREQHDQTRQETNAASYRERLKELDAESDGIEHGALEHEVEKQELLLRLSKETSTGPSSIHRRIAPQPGSAVVIATVLPLAALLIYLSLGQPTLFLTKGAPGPMVSRELPARDETERSVNPMPGNASASLERVVEKLERRLKENPADPDGWLLLSRSYIELDQLGRADAALSVALKANPAHPELLVTKAEVLGHMSGNRLVGKPAEILHRALAIAPAHRKALWLIGIAALQAGDASRALSYWGRLRATGPLKPEEDKVLSELIARAQTEHSGTRPGLESSSPPEPVRTPAMIPRDKQTSELMVSVTLSPELRTKVRSTDTLFVFARAANGPRMPLAIVRRTAADLPLDVSLDDSMAMVPNMKLSMFRDIVIGARISKSGTATPLPGDVFGEKGPVSQDSTKKVSITIEKMVR